MHLNRHGRSPTLRTLARLAPAMLMALGITGEPAFAHKRDTILYAFQGGSDGKWPYAGLTSDEQGNLYGTTSEGGGNFGGGTIFRITPEGSLSTLYVFSNGGAFNPQSPLLLDRNGNLFGTTASGNSYGTVFELSSAGTFRILHTFSGTDGDVPSSGLVEDGKTLYGVTFSGGSATGCSGGCGVVFSVSRDGTSEKTVYTFQGGNDGEYPRGALVVDNEGNVLGTTMAGGGTCYQTDCGTLYRIAPDGTETIIHAFAGGNDGAQPAGGLVMDTQGNVYGTTMWGGGADCGYGGCGTVFKFSANGTYSIVHAFAGGSDGFGPLAALIVDREGNLYGTTQFGGSSSCQGLGCGTVFKLMPDGEEKIIHSFDGHNDGKEPYGALAEDHDGYLYGTTLSNSRRLSECLYLGGCGTVFRVSK